LYAERRRREAFADVKEISTRYFTCAAGGGYFENVDLIDSAGSIITTLDKVDSIHFDTTQMVELDMIVSGEIVEETLRLKFATPVTVTVVRTPRGTYSIIVHG